MAQKKAAKKTSKKVGKGKAAQKPGQNEHRNLEEFTEDRDIIDIARDLDIDLLDHKIPTLKSLIRAEWEKRGIKELAFAALIPAHKFKKHKALRRENFQFVRKFNSDEILQKSADLSAACMQRNVIDEERKAVNKEYGAKIAAELSKINLLAGELQKGSENVLRTCDVKYDYDQATKIYYYEGAEVGRERMTKSDYQTELEMQ